jgi:hypothetical protein
MRSKSKARVAPLFKSFGEAFRYWHKPAPTVDVAPTKPQRIPLDWVIRASVDPMTQPVEAEVRKFLQIVSDQAKRAIGDKARPGVLQLSRIDPRVEDAKLVPSRFFVGDVEAMAKLAIGDAKAGHNVYVEARTVRLDVRGKQRGSLKDTAYVFALVIDSDADKGFAGNANAEPSLITESSPGNRHLWYFLTEAVTADVAHKIGKAIRAQPAPTTIPVIPCSLTESQARRTFPISPSATEGAKSRRP